MSAAPSNPSSPISLQRCELSNALLVFKQTGAMENTMQLNINSMHLERDLLYPYKEQ